MFSRFQNKKSGAGDGAKHKHRPLGIDDCEKELSGLFHQSIDISIQTFATNKEKALIVYVDGLVSKDLIDRDIMHPLKSAAFDGDVKRALKSPFNETEDIDEFVVDLLNGHVALFYGGTRKIYLIEFRNWNQRSVGEPSAESVVRGPKEGFTESIRTNTALIRRKIQHRDLVIEHMTIGRQTNTAVELVYMNGIVNRDILAEVKRRLGKIDVDAILESGYLEQYICDNPYSSASGIGLTQKPDIVAIRILEGRVAIVCDGTPHVLTIPEMFIECIQTSEDYYSRPVMGSMLRVVRLFGLIITILLPGSVVAVLAYNPEMVPAVFLSTVVRSMLKTPMSLSAEIFVMIVMFEILREAGTRLPQAVGAAITIVGSLIVGEAAVRAGIASEMSVIVVAITAVSGFIVPNLNEFTVVYRFLFWFLGATMGLIGIGSGIIIMFAQICSMSTFGLPILSSFTREEMKDSLLRFRLKSLRFRPASIARGNTRRKNM